MIHFSIQNNKMDDKELKYLFDLKRSEFMSKCDSFS